MGRNSIPLRRINLRKKGRKMRRYDISRHNSPLTSIHIVSRLLVTAKSIKQLLKLITSCPDGLMEPYWFVIENICGRWFVCVEDWIGIEFLPSASGSSLQHIPSISHGLMRNHNFISIQRVRIAVNERELEFDVCSLIREEIWSGLGNVE